MSVYLPLNWSQIGPRMMDLFAASMDCSTYQKKKDGIDKSRFFLNLEIGLVVFVQGLNTGASSLLLLPTATAARVPWAKFSVRFRAITCAHFTRDQRMFSISVYTSREFQGSFPYPLPCPLGRDGLGGRVTLVFVPNFALAKTEPSDSPKSVSLL